MILHFYNSYSTMWEGDFFFFSKCLLGILLANRYLYKFYYFLATDYTQIMQ